MAANDYLNVAEAARALGISEEELSEKEAAGLVVPKLAFGGEKLYSKTQIKSLLKSPISPHSPLSPLSPKFLFFGIISFLLIILALIFRFTYGSSEVQPLNPGHLEGEDKTQPGGHLPGESEGENSISGLDTVSPDFVFNVNVPAFFYDSVEFKQGATLTTLTADSITASKITADNIIYGLTSGSGISISLGQTPAISNTGVLSLQSQTGALTLTEGTDIAISGLTISNDSTLDTVRGRGGCSSCITDADVTDGLTISGGTINSTPVGATTPSTGAFTTLSASGATALSSTFSVSGASTFSGVTTFTGTISSDFVPTTASTYSLGSADNPWSALYLTGAATLGGQTTFTSSPTGTGVGDGSIYINPDSVADSSYTLFGIAVGGVEKLRMDATGNITVQGNLLGPTGGSIGYWTRSGTTLSPYTSGDNIVTTGNVGIGTTAPLAKLNLVGTGTSTGLNLLTTSSAGAFGLAVLDNGNVGIGTTNPGTFLHLSKSNVGQTTFTKFQNTHADTNDTADLDFSLSGTGTVTGKISNIRRDTPVAGGSDMAFYTYGTNGVTGGLYERMSIDATGNVTMTNNGGNVGIGIISPTNKFQVSGGNVGIGVSTAISTLAVNGNSTIGWGLTGVVGPSNGLAVYGNVGIGTTSVGAKLDISTTSTTGSDFRITNNSLNTGFMGLISSTSTSLTTGGLLSLDWSPTGSTAIYSTGDLFSINAGQFASVGNLFNLKDNGSSIFSVSQTQFTTSLPASFTSPGDTGISGDLLFNNDTYSTISSIAPLEIAAGENFNSSNLTFKTYNQGSVVINQDNSSPLSSGTDYAFQILPNLGIGTTNFSYSALYSSYNLPTINLTGSGSSVTNVYNSYLGLSALSGTITNWYGQYIAAPTGSGTVTNKYAFVTEPGSGNVGIGTTAPNYALDVIGSINTSTGLCIGGDCKTEWTGVGGYTASNGLTLTGTNFTLGGQLSQTTSIDINSQNFGFLGGNVGIGVTTAISTLAVNGNSTIGWGLTGVAGPDNGLAVFGNVGVGTTSPGYILDVQGDTAVNSKSGYLTDGGDYAEWFGASDPLISEAEVVSLDSEGKLVKAQGIQDKKVVGVISTKAGYVGNNPFSSKAEQEANKDKYKLVALVGQIPVKIASDSANIEVGDYLTSSDIPGEAKKASASGLVLGKALESWTNGSGKDRINLLIGINSIQTIDASPSSTINPQNTTFDSQSSIVDNLTPPDILLATGSATLNSTFQESGPTWKVSDATISAKLTAYEAVIQETFKSLGKTFLGETTIAGDLTVDGTMSITGNSINGLACNNTPGVSRDDTLYTPGVNSEICGILYLQNSPLAFKVDFFNGAVTIDKYGNLAVSGTITAKKYAVSNPDVLSASIGTGTIPTGKLSTIIKTSAVTLESKIFLTSHTPAILGVVSKKAGESFTVGTEKTAGSDILFDWWIIDNK